MRPAAPRRRPRRLLLLPLAVALLVDAAVALDLERGSAEGKIARFFLAFLLLACVVEGLRRKET